MKIGFILECGPEGADVKVCRHLVQQLDSNIEFISRTLTNKKKLIRECGVVAKILLKKCEEVVVVWDLFPSWRSTRPCRREDRQEIIRSLNAQNVSLNKVSLVCIREELEAWLIADNIAVTNVLVRLKHPYRVTRIPRPPHPDRISKPKNRLENIFRQEVGYKYVDIRHAIMIAKEINNVRRLKRSESFKRFAFKVAGQTL